MIFDILLIPHPTIHNLLKWAGITDENCDSLNSTEWSVLLKSYQFQHWLREVTDNSIDTDRSISSIVNLMSYQGTSMGKVNKLVNSFLFFQGDQNGMNIGNLDDLRQLLKICQIVLSPKRLDDYLDSLGDVQPNHLKLFEFIDLVQLTIPIPDFALNRQAVLKNVCICQHFFTFSFYYSA
ncbi:hypothetical protein BLNAU_15084 [Blattamonas nauphoetae]|uniref:Uncharacterized protein n=1 Tax=Blattamonas nauphoetae TaxID=2049346 RepID=A0ABQ9XBP1_9EUKA|nr:hypothetical protein BLNAU_15084 [Blattamonas nauphoetae]